MGVRIGWWTLDALDAPRLAQFYEQLTGWRRLFEDPGQGVALAPTLPPVAGQGWLLYAEHDTGRTTTKNRAHLDLAVRPEQLDTEVRRALDLGAGRADVGQTGDEAWIVLADPEGNEFCLVPVETSRPGGVDAVTLDVADPDRAASFWSTLLEWHAVRRDEDSVRLRAPVGQAWDLLLLRTDDTKGSKNRVHPELVPDGERGDEQARPREVDRALDLGATRADIGQGGVSWDVLADPDGNEFCVLAPGTLDL